MNGSAPIANEHSESHANLNRLQDQSLANSDCVMLPPGAATNNETSQSILLEGQLKKGSKSVKNKQNK